MYYNITYAKTSTLNRNIIRSTVLHFHDDKENIYKTFHTRMQDNRNSKYSGCSHCGKNLYAQPSSAQTNFCLNQEWYEYPLKENYCTNCNRTKRKQNVGSRYVNEDKSKHREIPENTQGYVTVFNTRRPYKSDSHAKGSMYGCDHIHVKGVPLYEDVGKGRGKGASDNQLGGKLSGNDEVGNYNPSETHSSNSKQSRNDIHKKSCQIGQPKRSQMSGIEHIERCGSYHKIDDISCTVDLVSGSVPDRKTTAESRSSKSEKFTNSKLKNNLEKDEVVGAQTCFLRSGSKKYQNDKSKCKSYPESNSSQKFIDSGREKSNPGKHKTIVPEKDLPQREDMNEKDTDEENKGKSKHSKNVKTENDEAPKPTGNSATCEKAKVPKGTKRMLRRRTQKKSQANVQPRCDSEKPETGGIDKWLLFILDSLKQGSCLNLVLEKVKKIVN